MSHPPACQADTDGNICEGELPVCLQEALATVRARRPQDDVRCLAFHSRENGREVAHLGPTPELLAAETGPGRLSPRNVVIISIDVTETTFESVRTVTHVLVARLQPRKPH